MYRLTKSGERFVGTLTAVSFVLLLGTGGAIESQGFTWGTAFWAALAIGTAATASRIYCGATHDEEIDEWSDEY